MISSKVVIDLEYQARCSLRSRACAAITPMAYRRLAGARRPGFAGWGARP